MAVTSLDILNLSHSLKDIAEVSGKTQDCLTQTLKTLLQYNLIQANLLYGEQLCCPCQGGGKQEDHSPQSPRQEGCVGLNISNPNRLHNGQHST